MNLQLWFVIFLMPLEVQGSTVPNLKDLRYGKDESRGLSWSCTSSIFQDVMKSDNFLHKQGFVDSLLQTIVRMCFISRILSDFQSVGSKNIYSTKKQQKLPKFTRNWPSLWSFSKIDGFKEPHFENWWVPWSPSNSSQQRAIYIKSVLFLFMFFFHTNKFHF